jgi:insulysin
MNYVSDLDNRNYYIYDLSNKIHRLDVKYSNDTDSIGVSVAIKCGFYNDPSEHPGLAHFIEHMLFLGSKKYPSHTLFSELLSKYNGTTNAFTINNYTVYYFSSNIQGFNIILDVFLHFFIDPLFSQEFIDKEINAIQSEHDKNIDSE